MSVHLKRNTFDSSAIATENQALSPLSDPIMSPTQDLNNNTPDKSSGTLESKDSALSRWMEWWSPWYLVDWLLALSLFVISRGIITTVVPVTKRYLLPGDPTVNFPVLPDIVPTWALLIICFPLPLVLFVVMQIKKLSLHALHHAFLGLMEAMAVNLIVTDLFKVLVGRHRPRYLNLCAPDNTAEGVPIDDSDCTMTDKSELMKAHLSFPSGHSSMSFCAMVFLSLYLIGSFAILNNTRRRSRRDDKKQSPGMVVLRGAMTYIGSRSRPLWKFILCLLPWLCAMLVAASRAIDYHHHFEDIIAGSMIGIVCASIFYLFNFHSPLSEDSGKPKYHYQALPAWRRVTTDEIA